MMVLLSFSFVACHNPRFALRDTDCPRSIARKTLHSRPSSVDCEWMSDEAFMHGHSRPVATRSTSASPGNLHAKDVHLFATATTPVYKNRFHLHQGWSFCIGCRSCRHDRHRIVHSTSYGSSNLPLRPP